VDDFARIGKNCKMSEKAIFLARFAMPVEKRRRNFAPEKETICRFVDLSICQCTNKAIWQLANLIVNNFKTLIQ